MQNHKKVCEDCGVTFTERDQRVAVVKSQCLTCRKKHTQANTKAIENLSKVRYRNHT